MVCSEVRNFYFEIFKKMDELSPNESWIQECRLMTIIMPKPNGAEDKYLLDSDEYLSLVREYITTKPLT